MAIVPNWSQPLVDCAMKMMSKSEISFGDLERIKQIAALLDGVPNCMNISGGLAQVTDRVEKRYQAAVKTLQDATSSHELEGALKQMDSLKGYKEAERFLQEGRGRFETLKAQEAAKLAAARKRKRLIMVAAAVVVIAIISGLILHNQAQNRRVLARIAEAQSLADSGKNEEAIEAVTALVQDGKTGTSYASLYTVTETVLETTAASEGYESAFALLSQLRDDISGAVQDGAFDGYARDQLKADALSPAERWDLLLMLNGRHTSVPDGTAEDVVKDYMAALPADEAWEVAATAVEGELLRSYSDVASNAFESAIANASGTRSWEIAQRAVNLKIAKTSDDTVRSAYQGYIASLTPEEAWPVVYAARRDDTMSVEDELFNSAYSAHIQGLAPEEAWTEYTGFAEDDMQKSIPDASKRQVLGGMLNQLTAELNAADHRDMAAWVQENRSAMDSIHAEPEGVLAFVYALESAGYDVAELFPDGIMVDVSVASQVRKLFGRILNSNESTVVPNTTTVLPVSISEYANLTNISSILSNDVDTRVAQEQMKDSHYRVRLLTQYLFRIPENMRPATFRECTALLCMQNTYQCAGTISHSTGYGSITNTSYSPFFSDIDMVTIYDLSDDSCGMRLYTKVNPADVEDDTWFNAHKKDNYVLLTMHMTGGSDQEALRQSYEEIVDNVTLLPIYLYLNTTTEDTAEDSQEEANEAD